MAPSAALPVHRSPVLSLLSFFLPKSNEWIQKMLQMTEKIFIRERVKAAR